MTSLYVIAGGPGVGKTSVINEIKKRGYSVIPEAARLVSQTDPRFIGKSIHEIEKKSFHDAIIDLQINQLKQIKTGIIFSDRGIGDTLAYIKINKLLPPKISYPPYKKIFVLDPLPKYETDFLRTESKKEQDIIHAEIIKSYHQLKYEIIKVPIQPIKARVEFILQNSAPIPNRMFTNTA